MPIYKSSNNIAVIDPSYLNGSITSEAILTPSRSINLHSFDDKKVVCKLKQQFLYDNGNHECAKLELMDQQIEMNTDNCDSKGDKSCKACSRKFSSVSDIGTNNTYMVSDVDITLCNFCGNKCCNLMPCSCVCNTCK